MTTTKTIAAAGDYATMRLAEAGLAAFDAGADMTDPWVFNVANEHITETAGTTWSGSYGGLSSTNTITIQPGSGFGFADNNDFSSVTLDIKTASGKGAWFDDGDGSNTVPIVFSSHMVIQGLQFRYGKIYASNMTITGSGDQIFRRNIVRVEERSLMELTVSGGNTLIANNLFIMAACTGVTAAALNSHSSGGTITIVANTFATVRIHPGSGATPVAFRRGTYATAADMHQNAAYTYDQTNGIPFSKGGGGGETGDWNVQNGTHTGGTDLPSDGSHSSTAGDVAADLEIADINSGAKGDPVDLRPKAAGLLLAFIPSASRFTGSGFTAGAADTDIRGQTRVGVNNDCGCFQKTVAAGATFKWWMKKQFNGGFRELTGGFDG